MVRIGDYGVLERVDLQCLPREREKLTGWGSRATGRKGVGGTTEKDISWVEFALEGEAETEKQVSSGLIWREIDIGLEIVTVFRILFIFNSFIFLNNANVEKCGSFKSFSYIYIYIYR